MANGRGHRAKQRERAWLPGVRVELLRVQWEILAGGKPYGSVATNGPDPMIDGLESLFQGKAWKNGTEAGGK